MTRFAQLSRPAAWAVVGGFLAVLGWGLAAAPNAHTWVLGADAIADRDFFRETVTRLHAGEGYYAVQADQHRGGGTSTFNWRPPLYLWGLAALPNPDLGRWLLMALALASVAAAGTVLAADLGPTGTVGTAILLMGGTFAWCVYEPETFLLAEPWCGPLLLLSLAAYTRGRWSLGVAAGLAALFVRELALPYCGITLVISIWNRRWAEVGVWVVGLGLAVGLFRLHAAAVAAHEPAAAVTAARWVGFTGIGPLLGSGAMNVFVYPLPASVRAVYFALALLGLAAWRGETGARAALSAAGYVVPMLAVPGWDYWGLVYSPLLILGLVRSPAALWDLLKQTGRGSRGSKPADENRDQK